MLDIRKALALGLLLAGLLAGTANAKTLPRASTGSPAHFNIEDGHFDSVAQARSIARRYQVLISFSDQPMVGVLHAANPHLKVLMYASSDYATVRDPSGGMSCTTVSEDTHSGWLAHTSSGAPVVDRGDYATALGNPSFQQACVGHMIALAKRRGFDGIFLDGMNYRFSFAMPGAPVNPFGSDAAYAAATGSLLRYAASAVHASGLELFANVAAANSAQWAAWNAPLDGAMQESWTDGGLGLAQQLPWWRQKLADAAWSQAHGKYLLLHSYNPSEAANVYGLAAMLLLADGRTSYSTWNNGQTDRHWFPEYNTAQRLGPALGGYRVLRSGVYERVFAHGIVLVNPSRHRVRRISLHGRYSGTHLHKVRSVAMRPLSAMILLRGR
jgi:Hypothetical glycosyl hydrolase family 15